MTIRRKLIEASNPLAEINRQSAREESIRNGHRSTAHLWRAHRPLAAARCVHFAQLVDDPSSWINELRDKSRSRSLTGDKVETLAEAEITVERQRPRDLVNWDNRGSLVTIRAEHADNFDDCVDHAVSESARTLGADDSHFDQG